MPGSTASAPLSSTTGDVSDSSFRLFTATRPYGMATPARTIPLACPLRVFFFLEQDEADGAVHEGAGRLDRGVDGALRRGEPDGLRGGQRHLGDALVHSGSLHPAEDLLEAR